MLYDLFKKVAFQMDPEAVHNLTIGGAAKLPFLAKCLNPQIDGTPKYSVKVGGVQWQSPVGLAAGLDKNAEAIDFFASLAFGAIEIGTVTPKPQSGNPKPRLFRLERDKSLRNKMGFNNRGGDEVFKNVVARKTSRPVGVNLGKNKTTPQDKAAEDYATLYQQFAPVADYLVINVSSPNTPGLRDLGEKSKMQEILQELQDLRAKRPCPLFIKISPDMHDQGIQDFIDLAHDFELDGIIATNTTIMPDYGDGGVSGKLLYEKAKLTRNYLLDRLKGGSVDLIGVGGFRSFQEIKDYWQDGGRAVQIYTSFIYKGPEILSDVIEGIDELLEQTTCNTLEQYFEQLN